MPGPSLTATRSSTRCAIPDPRSHQNKRPDRKSTRLNSSHLGISYAVFCLKTAQHTPTVQTLNHLESQGLHDNKVLATTDTGNLVSNADALPCKCPNPGDIPHDAGTSHRIV